MPVILLLPTGFRRLLVTCGLLAVLLLPAVFLYPSRTVQGLLRARAQKGPVVVLDPGHGGVDGGARDERGILEKNINLAVALRVRDYLQTNGVDAVLTRTVDTDLSPFVPGKKGRHRRDLAARIQKARATGGLFLVSFHCDWSPDKKRRGAVVYYNPHSPTGKKLALLIQEELNKIQAAPAKAAPANYFILTQKGVTGVLIEMGFLSHPEEARLLATSPYQDRLSRAVTRAILFYCRNYQALSGP